MKKLFATFIALCMLLSMSGMAFATDEVQPEDIAVMDAETAAEAITDGDQTLLPAAESDGTGTQDQPSTAESQSPATQPATTKAAATITKSKAISIALKNAKLIKSKTKRLEAEYDREDGIYEIEFVKKKNGAEFDYDISAKNGRILEKSVDYKYKHVKGKKKIGKKKARKIVAKRAKVSYSVVKKGRCKYEYSHREGKYEITYIKGNYKYEYEILAPTGKVIEYGYTYLK